MAETPSFDLKNANVNIYTAPQADKRKRDEEETRPQQQQLKRKRREGPDLRPRAIEILSADDLMLPSIVLTLPKDNLFAQILSVQQFHILKDQLLENSTDTLKLVKTINRSKSIGIDFLTDMIPSLEQGSAKEKRLVNQLMNINNYAPLTITTKNETTTKPQAQNKTSTSTSTVTNSGDTEDDEPMEQSEDLRRSWHQK